MGNGPISEGALIAVIGAGVIGTAVALDLVQRGYCVTVFDPFAPGMGGPSRRNAGHIAASDIHPLSTPGIARTGLKLLLKKDGPLKVPGVEKIRLIPWFLKFLATSRGQKYRNACDAMSYLCQSALEDTETMLSVAGNQNMMSRCSVGYIYDSSDSRAASQPAWKEKAAAGIGVQTMDRAQLAQCLPEINAKFRHAMISHNWGSVTDPLDVVQAVAGAATLRGVSFERSTVMRLTPLQNGVRIHTADRQHKFDAVVVAAGIRSKPFAAALGDTLPLVAERGYNLTFPDPGFDLKMPLVLPDRGIAITQLSEGLRIGGWAEYAASPDRRETQSYYKALARISQEIFPDLRQTRAVRWMGNRPSLPDSIPVISKSHSSDRIFYNCGHGHYGLTHAASSAKILGGLIDGRDVPAPHQAFTINRFI